ncbi:heavy metal-associated isoprenylated plant protein 47-like [Nymphaea colorata]|nr:heavy metal-associated isoprenylated plant protein 47-like [Nymphaea colorata]
MKQKLALQLDMFDEKRRAKAMRTVVGAQGVLSVALDGKEKRKLVVVGEHMDAFELVKSLKKKNFRVDMESLEEVKSEKK